jgi:hypothetical protein
MMKPLKVGIASALALATAAPAFSQQYRPTDDYVQRQREYDAQRDRYEAQRGQYEASRENYRESRRNYADARRDYERRLREWDRARGIYDRRYGSGAYARLYPRPVWDTTTWTRYEAPPYAGYYGRNSSASTVPCSTSGGSGNTVAGGLIGALAGAVLGSQVASRGARTEGAVLGGVAGAVIGGSIGNSRDRDYKCDARGPYFTESETVPYREGSRRYSSAYDSSYYSRQRCRLAAAPVDAYGRDLRYVRVCPDETGRYRITG